MKTLAAILLVLTTGMSIAQQKTDSLIINVGSSKVIILVNDPKDLDQLAEYDLNKILSDLKLKLSEDSLLVDENNRTVQDTTIVAQDSNQDRSVLDEEREDHWRRGDDDDDSWRRRDDDNDRWRETRKTTSYRRRGSRHFLNFDLGTNNYLSDGDFPDSDNAQYAVRPWGSWYFGINSVYQIKVKGRFYFEVGPGISWYNFKFQDDNTRIEEIDGVTSFYSDPDNNYKKSKLTASFINVTAVPMFQFGRERKRRSVGDWRNVEDNWSSIKIGGSDAGFRIGLGGYAGYRLTSRSKVKFQGGKKDKDRDNFNLMNFRYGARLQMGWKGTDLFFNYDLNELFSEGQGPKLNAFSFGIIL